MMDVREVERKLPFSIDSNETPGSLNRPKLSNEIIESIVRNSLLPVPEGEKKREFKDYTQHILRGEKSLLDTPSFWFKSAPPLKPLSITTQELAQLGEVIKLSPVSLDSICLIEVLGLHTYAAFDALEEALRAGGEKKIRSFKITFCKHWLIGYLSQGNQFRPKIAWTYTSQEFIDNIQRLIESIQERSKISQLQYQQHYKEALRGLNLLVCLWNSDNACQILQGLCCYHLADLKPWFNQEQESSTTYQGVALWLEFITCAFKNTACFHDGNTYYLTLLEELKTFLEPTQEISCILKRQQKMLVAIHRLIQDNAEQTREFLLIKIKEPIKAVHFRKNNVDRCAHISMYNFIFIKLFINSMYMLEDATAQVHTSYTTIRAYLVRVDISNKLFCQNLIEMTQRHALRHAHEAEMLKRNMASFPRKGFYFYLTHLEKDWIASSLEQHGVSERVKKMMQHFLTGQPELEPQEGESTLPIHTEPLTPTQILWMVQAIKTEVCVGLRLYTEDMHFLIEEEKKAFFKVCVEMTHTVQELIKEDEDFLKYAEKKAASQELHRSMWMIEEYASLYSKIVRFLDHVSSVLESLHTAHAEKLIEATDLLPIEVRIQHQEAILHFFENFLLDLMSPFTLVSILKHDIEVLVPTALKSPDVAFIETGLGKYLLMWQFEQDFLEKVANAKQQAQADLQATLLQEDALKQVEESTQESLSVLEKPVFKNRKASFKKSEAEKSPSKPVELKQPIDIGIHRGEKVRRILKAMHAHHLQPDHFTGDHEILEDQLTGCKLTLSTHGQHVSRKVTRSIQRRIREMNEARQNAAK